MNRMVLVMLLDGTLIRTADVPEGAIIIDEPPDEVPEQVVIDQTSAVNIGRARARFDIE